MRALQAAGLCFHPLQRACLNRCPPGEQQTHDDRSCFCFRFAVPFSTSCGRPRPHIEACTVRVGRNKPEPLDSQPLTPWMHARACRPPPRAAPIKVALGGGVSQALLIGIRSRSSGRQRRASRGPRPRGAPHAPHFLPAPALATSPSLNSHSRRPSAASWLSTLAAQGLQSARYSPPGRPGAVAAYTCGRGWVGEGLGAAGGLATEPCPARTQHRLCQQQQQAMGGLRQESVLRAIGAHRRCGALADGLDPGPQRQADEQLHQGRHGDVAARVGQDQPRVHRQRQERLARRVRAALQLPTGRRGTAGTGGGGGRGGGRPPPRVSMHRPRAPRGQRAADGSLRGASRQAAAS
jgi:hypothetical protein